VIRRIQIDNFKSLDGFSLPPVASPPLANFTCLIGANGSGKTSVLQVLDFLCYFMRGDVRGWLKDRGWEDDRLSSSFDSSPVDLFKASILIQLDPSTQAEWSVHYNLYTRECYEEKIVVSGDTFLEVKDGDVTILEGNGPPRIFTGLSLRGSALEALQVGSAPNPLGLIKELFRKNLATFELFSPNSLKKQSLHSKSMGRHGENLAGFAGDLGLKIQRQISDRMREFYPNNKGVLVALDHDSKLFRLFAPEEFLREAVPSSQFSDGFTRILAIVTQIESSTASDRVLLIDEIEDGIHPELMAKLIDYLVKSNTQVIATTHSPLILNYLTDDQARKSVLLLYRNSEGRTRSCRYFDLPSTSKKLGVLGPGEVYVDTPIEKLAKEAEKIEQKAEKAAGAAAQ
jgi:predicted ATPase